ncbi:DUF1206 domain-containing protein [Altererythrobacter aerius]|uniref:DUF1206 domain-containing protein n=1 Tax=Tsuneonella aeria TaxID=1837929 RepID=A0A6I4T929_9SPHN|nr:DUF1206 domain-containing protein [Tsuneonella aeria]MXO73831.1 DUF1206 domain-containing protein [Tsuneonella aeria]
MVDKSEKFSWLVRIGYAARGVVYILLGYLALSTAGKAGDGQAAVFDMIQDAPMGEVILYLVALGLLAYAVFKAIDAASNIESHSDDASGKGKRVGAAASAIAHLVLAYTAYQFAAGEKQQSAGEGGSGQEVAGSLLTWDMGPVLLGLVGLGFLVAAAVQAKNAYTGNFMKHVSGSAPRYVEPIGRAGHASRAVVFALIGWSLIKGAWFSRSGEIKGLGEALVALSDNGVIYPLVALGLILFGVFSLIIARYRIIPDIRKDNLKPRL